MDAAPYIKEVGNEVITICPFCGNVVYRREPGVNQEISCSIALGAHVAHCKDNPDYVESEMDKLIKDIFNRY
jgi:hypothetical protein